MCNRFTMTFDEEQLREFLGMPELDPAISLPRYNVAPSQTVPVLRLCGTARELVVLKWGLVPKWAGKDSHVSAGLLNARWETAGEKPAFREAANRRRCAIPADGYLEWTTVGRKKQPHWFRLNGGRPFLFAGLWEPGAPDTVAILTHGANDDTREFHDRMPAILPEEKLNEWLDPTKDWNAVRDLLGEHPAGAITQIAVNPKINSARGENAEWLEEYRDTLFG